MRTALLIPTATAAVAIAVAGCGGGYTAASAPASAAAKHAVVKTRHGAVGTYLVDGRGRTLYRFMKDAGRRSRCSGACAQVWPPLTSREKPEAEGGAQQRLLGTSPRAGGARQVVYAGHPLYRYSADSAAGDTNGQGLNTYGGRWWVVSPSGRAIKQSPSAAPAPYGY